MVDSMTLLPPNATAQERALEAAVRLRDQVHAGVDGIVSFKEVPPESVLLWLVWEYGLEELLPYLPSARDVIEKGLDWERIKGTPEAVRLAMSWLTDGAPAIEEETPGGPHWAEFMLDPGFVPDSTADMQAIIALARMSAPVGTILARVFHGYDVRRFLLDGSQFGDLLSDYSGVRDADLGLVLSFGRTSTTTVSLDDGEAQDGAKLSRGHLTHNKYDDRLIWDFGRFGDVPLPNHPFMHAHLFQVDGEGVQVDQLGADTLVLPKAAMALSDGFALGDTNAALFAIEYVEHGTPLPLSDGLALSGEPWRIEKRPVDERFDRETACIGQFLFESSSATGGDNLRTSSALNTATADQQFPSTSDNYRTTAARVQGQFWTGIPWISQAWGDVEYIVRTKHYGDSA